MKTIIPFALFILGCNAKCWDIKRGEDHVLATCEDEDTQEPFDYINFDMKPDNEHDVDLEYMAERIYEDYASYANQGASSNAMSRRDDPEPFWSQCKNAISGFCTGVGFEGLQAIASVGTLITAALARAQQDDKMDTKPKTQCYKRNGNQACIGYAITYYRKLDEATLEAIGKECAENCAQQNEDCDFNFKTENSAQYQCVTSKAKSCSKPSRLRECD